MFVCIYVKLVCVCAVFSNSVLNSYHRTQNCFAACELSEQKKKAAQPLGLSCDGYCMEYILTNIHMYACIDV